MRNYISNQRVIKAEGNIITEALYKEDEVSEKKISIFRPPSSIKEEDKGKENSRKDDNTQATEQLSECKLLSEKFRVLDAYIYSR